MQRKLKNQLLYIITTEALDYREYYLPYYYYTDTHIKAYRRFLEENPELEYNYDLILASYLPERLREEGMVVYLGTESIPKEYINKYGYEYSGGIYLPNEFKEKQKEILATKMEELKDIYIELTYHDGDKIQYEFGSSERDNIVKIKAYSRLENILYSKKG